MKILFSIFFFLFKSFEGSSEYSEDVRVFPRQEEFLYRK